MWHRIGRLNQDFVGTSWSPQTFLFDAVRVHLWEGILPMFCVLGGMGDLAKGSWVVSRKNDREEVAGSEN